jgi:hypothetical protein
MQDGKSDISKLLHLLSRLPECKGAVAEADALQSTGQKRKHAKIESGIEEVPAAQTVAVDGAHRCTGQERSSHHQDEHALLQVSFNLD